LTGGLVEKALAEPEIPEKSVAGNKAAEDVGTMAVGYSW
jgi:hypothetical protein